MNDPAVPHWNLQHNWARLTRAAPPKRSAAERVADFMEIYADFDEATAREEASRCIQCPNPTCMQGCPLGNRIPDWLALTAEGHFLEASTLSQSTSNLPELCSRVCPQERLCEGSCILNGPGEPVAIGALERFINEYAFRHAGVPVDPAEPNGHSVAVIGAGPGGLACADQLVKLGYAVTVFESQLVPGGLLVNGIPSFKLEKHLVMRRVEVLKQRGVKFLLGVRVGWNFSLAHLQRDFEAVFIGIGAQQAKPLDVPGAQLVGVSQGLPFLIEKNLQLPFDHPSIEVLDKRVAVLGGGDTAMDCLRTAIRAGASDATCLYRRDFNNMPGSRKEYFNALEEGARFEFLVNPIEVLGDREGRVTAIRCVRMELGAPDASGRRKPRPIPGSEFTQPADVVLIAYGFDPVPFPADSDFAQLCLTDWGGLVVDQNQMTSLPGVFAGGDSVRGPSLVVHAVRDARRAAAAMHRYICAKSADAEPLSASA